MRGSRAGTWRTSRYKPNTTLSFAIKFGAKAGREALRYVLLCLLADSAHGSTSRAMGDGEYRQSANEMYSREQTACSGQELPAMSLRGSCIHVYMCVALLLQLTRVCL